MPLSTGLNDYTGRNEEVPQGDQLRWAWKRNYGRSLLYIHLLKNRAFVLYLSGAFASGLGDAIAGLGFLFATYRQTGSATHTTGVFIAQTIPYLLFGLLGGTVSDKLPRLPLMLWLDLARGILQVGVFVCFLFEQPPYELMVVIVFLIHGAGAFFNPAHRTMLPDIIPADQLAMANALVSLSSTSAPMLAPAVTALLLSTSGLAGFFVFDAASYFVSAMCLMRMRYYIRAQMRIAHPPDRTIPLQNTGWGVGQLLGVIHKQIREFVAFTRFNVTLIVLFTNTFLIVFCSTWVVQVGLLLQATVTTPNSEQLYAVVMGIYAALSSVASLSMP